MHVAMHDTVSPNMRRIREGEEFIQLKVESSLSWEMIVGGSSDPEYETAFRISELASPSVVGCHNRIIISTQLGKLLL